MLINKIFRRKIIQCLRILKIIWNTTLNGSKSYGWQW